VKKLKGYLRLMRPANIVTAIADILAGIVISGYMNNRLFGDVDFNSVILLVCATIGLYGGGVVLNDVMDAKLDKLERPERPIPSGLISASSALLFGVFLLVAGVLVAFFNHFISGGLALSIALAAVLYDAWGKHQSVLGPVNMGLCRGLNLLLGISIIPSMVSHFWYLSLVPLVYIAAITMISRGEVHGGKKTTLYVAALLYMAVITIIGYSGYLKDEGLTFVFLLAFGLMIYWPLLKAIESPVGPRIGKAVKYGVLALILMNAAWAMAFGSLYGALFILLLLPLSLWLAKIFAVT
jgi:4-hydroxybenzoate polyprenyltransferase